MDILEKRYRPSATGVFDSKPIDPTKYAQDFPRDYTATEKLDLVAWLNERDAGYPTATVSAIRQ